MSWRLRVAIAVGMGVVSTLAVAVFVALFPVEQWLGLGVGAQADAVVKTRGNGELWSLYIRAERSPMETSAEVEFWPAAGDDFERYRMIGPGGVPLSPDSTAIDCVDLRDFADVPISAGDHVYVHRVGWPALALEWRETRVQVTTTGLSAAPSTTGGIVLALGPVRGTRFPTVIPYMPRWRGLMEDVGA